MSLLGVFVVWPDGAINPSLNKPLHGQSSFSISGM